jgi:hypothetical protein
MTLATGRVMDTHTYSRKSFVLAVAALALPLVTSCGPDRRVVTQRHVVTTTQPAEPAPKTIDISIVGLHDEPAADPAQEKVVGTIINEGDKRVTGVSIRVNALDSRGNVVRTVVTPPLAQPIDPSGGRATFEALMPRDPAVAGYHAVAIAR